MSILQFLKFLKFLKSILVCHLVEAFFPKKYFLKSLSIPTTSKPFWQKKSTDSEPTNPLEPVIRTKDIKSIFSDYIYSLKAIYMYHSQYQEIFF